MSVYGGPEIVNDNLLLSLDFDNSVNYVSGTTATSLIAPNTFTFKNGLTYNSVADGILTTTRAATVTTKANDGGGIYSTLTGGLTAASFLYNNHTWEIWFRINDLAPSNYDATETFSNVAGYAGYNAGFSYNQFNLYYAIWDGITGTINCSTFSVGTTSANIIQGNWYQMVVTRLGNVFTPYVNGVQTGTGSTSAPSAAGIGTSNVMGIGSNNIGNYINYAKMSFSNMKMYSAALSAAEVLQNFNALRGRFGL